MFKRLRIALLLYILLFVAVGEFLAARRSTDWHDTLWVDVYPVNGDRLASTERYIDDIDPKEFDGVERFFTAEAQRYGLSLAQGLIAPSEARGLYPASSLAPVKRTVGTSWPAGSTSRSTTSTSVASTAVIGIASST